MNRQIVVDRFEINCVRTGSGTFTRNIEIDEDTLHMVSVLRSYSKTMGPTWSFSISTFRNYGQMLVGKRAK